jgi:hypothetical protein
LSIACHDELHHVPPGAIVVQLIKNLLNQRLRLFKQLDTSCKIGVGVEGEAFGYKNLGYAAKLIPECFAPTDESTK